jgi:hypothetical protein
MSFVPELSKMWEHYPNTRAKEQVAKLVGGTIGSYITKYDWDTCCVRVSRALNYGGAPVQGLASIPNPYMDPPKVRAATGEDKKLYIYSVYDLRAYLKARFGTPKSFSKSISKEDLGKKGVTGLIMFFPPHADLWDGSDVRYNDDLFGDKRVQEVLIWESQPPANTGS